MSKTTLFVNNVYKNDSSYNVSAVEGKVSANINSTMNKNGDTVGAPVDAADFSKNASGVAKTSMQRSAKEINQSIVTMCQKYSLDVNKLKTGIENITGLVKDEDKKTLSETQQVVLLTCIEDAMKHAIKFSEKYKNIDIVEEVLFDSFITSSVLIKHKTFNDLKSYDDAIRSSAPDFIKGISEIKSVKEFEKLKAGLEFNLKEQYEQKLAEIRKLPESEQPAALENLKAQHAAMRQRILSHYVFGKTSNEYSMNALTIANAEDTGKMTNGLYKMQATDNDRKELANKFHSFGLDQRILMAYEARGEAFNKEAWEEYVQVNTSWKTEKTLNKYHSAVMTALKNGKLENEVFKATTKGIVIGAQINHVLIGEEKRAFIEKWTSDIKNCYDEDSQEYKEIKSYVEQKIEEYNKAQIAQSEETKKLVSSKPVSNNSSNAVTNPIARNIVYSGAVEFNSSSESDIRDTRDDKEKIKALLTRTSTKRDIAEAIQKGSITVVEAISNFSEKGYEALFESRDLLLQNKPIAELYINYNNKDLKKLLSLSKFQSAVELISKRISPTIKDKYEKEVNLSLTMREAIFGKDKTYAIS